ncbi:MAG: phosphatidylserine/phosphatidylglycerophosphate/cardiolipin synthase family protein [Ktedonobacterales bacterium]
MLAMRPVEALVRRVRGMRRPRVLRLALWATGALLASQAATVAVLSVVVARRRKQRRVEGGFPHLEPAEVTVGENQLKIFTYGRDLYEAMFEAIDAANENIYFETFIWKGDEVGQEFKERLLRKAREGVKVYAVFDGFGNGVVPREFKEFPPEIQAMEYRALRKPWHIFDPRRYALDHRKLLMVDGTTGFIGGYNIGSLYATEWRDTHLRIQGPAAAQLAQSFTDFWNHMSSPKRRIKRHYRRHFNPLISLHGTNALRLTFPIRDMYIEAIDRAENRILLTNAYFIPDHVLLTALKEAAARDVEVQVLLPWNSNHIVADWLARGYFTECLLAGVRLFGYRNAMIHAKTCTIDGQWSTIGTANLDRLSSVGNYEINLEVYSPELAHEMEEVFERDKTNAVELTLEHWLPRPWYQKISEKILAPLRVAL